MSDQPEKKNDRRYLANVKQYSGQHGPYEKALVNNTKAQKDDGTPDPYYAGALIWCDVKTGRNYQVKQMAIRKNKNGGESITIDLGSEYEVTPLA